MSFAALALAAQAVDVLEPDYDEEFGFNCDMDWCPDLDVTWALYRSAGSGMVFGVKDVRRLPLP